MSLSGGGANGIDPTRFSKPQLTIPERYFKSRKRLSAKAIPMLKLRPMIDESVAAIRQKWDGVPRVGIILGTGLSSLASHLETAVRLDYSEIPHFPQSTALSHKGQLCCGTLAGRSVVIMDGRTHFYEGYATAEITFPIRVMRELGISTLIVSNASGGVNPIYAAGDIVVIDDHINLMAANPLGGVNDDELGPRFPDMCRPYDPALIDRVLEIARQNAFVAHRGVLAAMSGPNYESRAEYRFLRGIGADIVGMSTAPEVIVAAHAGLRVLAMSVVTNVCNPDSLEPASGEAVVAVAESAEPRLRQIVLQLLADE